MSLIEWRGGIKSCYLCIACKKFHFLLLLLKAISVTQSSSVNFRIVMNDLVIVSNSRNSTINKTWFWVSVIRHFSIKIISILLPFIIACSDATSSCHCCLTWSMASCFVLSETVATALMVSISALASASWSCILLSSAWAFSSIAVCFFSSSEIFTGQAQRFM